MMLQRAQAVICCMSLPNHLDFRWGPVIAMISTFPGVISHGAGAAEQQQGAQCGQIRGFSESVHVDVLNFR
jgi:hypothetical protein